MDKDEIILALGPDSKWDAYESSIQRDFTFPDNKKAHDFVNQIGLLSAKFNHHPDIFIHSYNNVKLTLMSHDVEDVTQKDIQLSREIDTLYDSMS